MDQGSGQVCRESVSTEPDIRGSPPSKPPTMSSQDQAALSQTQANAWGLSFWPITLLLFISQGNNTDEHMPQRKQTEELGHHWPLFKAGQEYFQSFCIGSHAGRSEHAPTSVMDGCQGKSFVFLGHKHFAFIQHNVQNNAVCVTAQVEISNLKSCILFQFNQS